MTSSEKENQKIQDQKIRNKSKLDWTSGKSVFKSPGSLHHTSCDNLHKFKNLSLVVATVEQKKGLFLGKYPY